MTHTLQANPCWIALPALLSASVFAQEPGERFIDLVRAGKPTATVVLPADDAPIWADVARILSEPTQRWGGVAPPVVRLASDGKLPDGDLIIVGTPQSSQLIAQAAADSGSLISRTPYTADGGFAIECRSGPAGGKNVVIAGKDPRGAYNGAVACRDFALDASAALPGKADVFIHEIAMRRSPQMQRRGTYCLSIYGVAMKYTADDWKKIIDRYAEDGMNLVCFWLSGHHPSKKFPQLFNVDATKGTKLTVDGVTDLIRYCHDRGIRFYIGGGVFAWTASHYLMEGHPEIAAVKAGGLCPSKPYARQAQREHFLEMYQTWPESDGFMFEIRDEQGECQCEECQKKIDEFGSKAYGKAEITWLQEFAREAWKINPKLHFCWLLGYAEHTHDVYYYDQIRHMNDPRFEWIDPRVGLDGNGKWVLPGPGGQPRPFAFFSHHIAHWDPFYRHPLEYLNHWANRIADEGLDGYIPAFEPGFGSGSYYWDKIPLPVNDLPYTLTGFAYRELTWEPGITMDQLKKRIQQRYFSSQADMRFVDDMIELQKFSFDNWDTLSFFAKDRFGYSGESIPKWTVAGELKRVEDIKDAEQHKQQAHAVAQKFKKLYAVADGLKRMDAMEKAMQDASATASPKTLDGFALLRRFIDDTRTLYHLAVPDEPALAQAIHTLSRE